VIAEGAFVRSKGNKEYSRMNPVHPAVSLCLPRLEGPAVTRAPWRGLLLAGMLASLAVTIPASASSQAAGGTYLREEDYRVAAVAYRLGVSGKPHCSAHLPLTGLFLHYLPEYGPENRGEAVRLYGVDRGPGVLSVVTGSPAAAAGLRAGDVLLGMEGASFPTGETLLRAGEGKKWRHAAAADVETRLEERLRAGPVRLQVLRDGRRLELRLDSVPGCPVRSRLARSTQANAFADGRTAIMTTRLLAFVRNDDELAVVLAHEAAHNILGHPGRLEADNLAKGFFGHFGAGAARVRATEVEADRLAVKLVWAAGYDTAAAIPFWRRLYGTFDPVPTPKLFARHPSLAARERIVAETLAELGQKPEPATAR
jgi:hypothetical protein